MESSSFDFSSGRQFMLYKSHTNPGFRKTREKFLDSIEKKGTDYIGIVSIDPASKHLGFYITLIWDTLKVTNLVLEIADFTVPDQESDDFGIKEYDEANKFFDRYIDIVKECHFIVIEKQMTKNPNMIRMIQHLITYFMIKTADRGVKPQIVVINAGLKTRSLGFKKTPGRKGNTELKNFSEEMAIRIIEKTGSELKSRLEKPKITIEQLKQMCRDHDITKFAGLKKQDLINLLGSYGIEVRQEDPSTKGKKKDDMADSVCQAWAWILLCEQKKWIPFKTNFKKIIFEE